MKDHNGNQPPDAFDQAWRNAFEGAQVPPPEGVWARVEQHVVPGPQRSKPRGWLYWQAAAILLLLLVGGWLYTMWQHHASMLPANPKLVQAPPYKPATKPNTAPPASPQGAINTPEQAGPRTVQTPPTTGVDTNAIQTPVPVQSTAPQRRNINNVVGSTPPANTTPNSALPNNNAPQDQSSTSVLAQNNNAPAKTGVVQNSPVNNNMLTKGAAVVNTLDSTLEKAVVNVRQSANTNAALNELDSALLAQIPPALQLDTIKVAQVWATPQQPFLTDSAGLNMAKSTPVAAGSMAPVLNNSGGQQPAKVAGVAAQNGQQQVPQNAQATPALALQQQKDSTLQLGQAISSPNLAATGTPPQIALNNATKGGVPTNKGGSPSNQGSSTSGNEPTANAGTKANNAPTNLPAANNTGLRQPGQAFDLSPKPVLAQTDSATARTATTIALQQAAPATANVPNSGNEAAAVPGTPANPVKNNRLAFTALPKAGPSLVPMPKMHWLPKVQKQLLYTRYLIKSQQYAPPKPPARPLYESIDKFNYIAISTFGNLSQVSAAPANVLNSLPGGSPGAGTTIRPPNLSDASPSYQNSSISSGGFLATVGYRLSDRWVVESGLGFWWQRGRAMANIVASDLSGTTIPIGIVNDVVFNTATTAFVNTELQSRVTYLTVPLHMGYVVRKGPVSATFKAGLDGNFLFGGRFDQNNGDYSVRVNNQKLFAPVLITANGGIDVYYRLAWRFDLGVSGQLRHSLNSIVQNGTGAQQRNPSFFLMGVNLRYLL